MINNHEIITQEATLKTNMVEQALLPCGNFRRITASKRDFSLFFRV